MQRLLGEQCSTGGWHGECSHSPRNRRGRNRVCWLLSKFLLCLWVWFFSFLFFFFFKKKVNKIRPWKNGLCENNVSWHLRPPPRTAGRQALTASPRRSLSGQFSFHVESVSKTYLTCALGASTAAPPFRRNTHQLSIPAAIAMPPAAADPGSDSISPMLPLQKLSFLNTRHNTPYKVVWHERAN